MSSSRNNYFKKRPTRRFGGSRRIKIFDPTNLISKSEIIHTDSNKNSDYQIKNQFNDFLISDQLKRNIADCGYVTPTPIQDQAIPHILEGRDLIGLANTGTGKTAAFLIPLINQVVNDNQKRVLIMTPTRELAVQIESEFRIFAKSLRVFSALFIGGTSMSSQIRNLKRSPHFIIGTPGRLIDLTKRKKLDLNSFSTLILDEVDRMLDMGFINDMEYVIKLMPTQRQTLFFSATLPTQLDTIISRFSNNPIKIEVKNQETTKNVEQGIVKINGQSKVEILNKLLKREGFDKVLVFGRTKHGLNKLAKELFGRGFRVATIHGNKSQSQRQKALTQFKTERVQILLATDVASRGLDINDVTHVINYDLPESQEAYIHRIGRTGRANKSGTALSFVD